MFDGFEEFDIPTAGASIHGRRGGSGPPVLLLHGIPETHLMWHRVQFSVVGHDRGARCAYRLALDHPDAVVRLAVMDVVPVGDAYDRADKDFSLVYWQWSFLAAPEPAPEQFINAAPATLVDFMLDTWPVVKEAFPAEVRATYLEKFHDPDTVHAICEEFRAAATLDYQQDEADRGNRNIACPVLFLWSQRGSVARLYDDPLAIWRGWADDVRRQDHRLGDSARPAVAGHRAEQAGHLLELGHAEPLDDRDRRGVALVNLSQHLG